MDWYLSPIIKDVSLIAIGKGELISKMKPKAISSNSKLSSLAIGAILHELDLILYIKKN